MNKLLRKFKRVNLFARCVFLSIIGVYVITFSFFAKSIISLVGIETLIRYFALVALVSYFLFYCYISFVRLIKKKYIMFSFLSFVSCVFIAVFCLSSYFIDVFYNTLSDLNENSEVIYSSYLIALDDTTLNSKSKIGMVADETDIEGNILAKKIIEDYDLKYSVKTYETKFGSAYIEMLYDLYEGKIDGVFVSSNYITLYSGEDDFKNIAKDTKILYKVSGEYSNKDGNITSNKLLTEPFTVLIMGVDSEFNGLNANAAFNGDTLMIATINPKTLSATLLSIPRDIYVPIACRNNTYAKINSSAYSGTACVINTIKNLLDIDIDYYVKINFKGVVDLVEAVNGIEVNVETPDYQYNHGVDCKGLVCEQNSDRKWGEDTIFIKPGLQTLNGEQALAYSRCRGLYKESDLARNRHQQDIIMALVSKIMKTSNYSQLTKILDAVSDNIGTNMNINQLLSSYSMLKNMVGNLINSQEVLNIQKAVLETYPLNVYLTNSGRITSALGYYEDSLNDIIKSMKVNLELESPEIVKTFNFSINENYEAVVSGKGFRNGVTNSVLKSFINQDKSLAEKYCKDNGFNCSFKYIDQNSEYYDADIEANLISAQTPHQGTLLKEVEDIVFYINSVISLEPEVPEEDLPDENVDSEDIEIDQPEIE